jgi:hypothetical protein
MAVPGGHMWVVMGGPDGQFCTLRSELEIGTYFGPPGGPGGPGRPWQGPKSSISTLWEALRALVATIDEAATHAHITGTDSSGARWPRAESCINFPPRQREHPRIRSKK